MTFLQPKHSYFCVQPLSNLTSNSTLQLLNLGVKVIFFTNTGSSNIPQDFYIFRVAKMLEIYTLQPQTFSKYSGLVICDGQFTPETRACFDVLAREVVDFNYEQYLVEHAPAEDHLCVEAGAGTGKTTVMIQRILFLLHTANASLKEMAMITFTREASQNMFHKLRKEFYSRYKATRNVKYLHYIE